jgi:hypothetical protein
MRIRFVLLPGLAAWLLLTAGAASTAAGSEVPTPLMAAAECMARVVKAMPGVSDVEITVSQAPAGAYPVLAYKFAEPSGLRRYTELSLFEISGIEDAPYVFDRDDIQDDPLAERLLPIWKARCRASFGYITSVPR